MVRMSRLLIPVVVTVCPLVASALECEECATAALSMENLSVSVVSLVALVLMGTSLVVELFSGLWNASDRNASARPRKKCAPINEETEL